MDVIKSFEKTFHKKFKIATQMERMGDVEEINKDKKKLKKIFLKFQREFSLKQSIQNMIGWEKCV